MIIQNADPLKETRRPAGPLPKFLMIQIAVAAHYGISRADLVGSSQYLKFTLPRKVAVFLIREFIPAMSVTWIGRRFESRSGQGKDHGTIVHSIQNISARIAADPAFAAEVDEIRAAIDGRACHSERTQVAG